jgi:DNA-binding NtrC family response regulator
MSTARILVVVNNATMLDAASGILRRVGYEVFPVASPRQALEIVKNNSPDLVLSDIVMREMRGTQLVRETVRLSPQTVGVLMTGYVSGNVPDNVALLRKPFTSQKLIRSIEAALPQSVK